MRSQLGVFIAALVLVTVGNAYWWKLSVFQVSGPVPWFALILFWIGLVYFYAIHFETITRDGGPTYMLFRFIDESPDGARTRQEILDYFRHQSVLTNRMEALVKVGWLERTSAGSHIITWRGRFVLFFLDGWTRVLGYEWGG
jgi:hypothetical protein